MKPIKEYFKNKELKVEYLNAYNVVINRELLLEIIKEIQIDTIKTTVQACADNADADVEFCGWLAEESLKSGETFEEGEDYEVYVIESSILEVAEKLIKEL